MTTCSRLQKEEKKGIRYYLPLDSGSKTNTFQILNYLVKFNCEISFPNLKERLFKKSQPPGPGGIVVLSGDASSITKPSAKRHLDMAGLLQI